jgi:hypothetical protein
VNKWLLSLILLLVPQLTLAGPIEEFSAFFRSASGVVIMPAGEEFLVDLDATKGIREGDLLTVVVPGEKIVHPVSGEILGNLDAVKGILRVTQVKAGYSVVRPIGQAEGIKRGDTVRRWDKVPAAFRGEGENAAALHRELKTALPHLDWRDAAKDVPLTFVLRDGQLEARGPDDELLVSTRIEPQPGPTKADVGIITPPPPVSPGTIIAAPAAKPPSGIIGSQAPTADGVWLSPKLAGEAVGVHVSDMDGDGRQEIAVAFPYRLDLGRIADGKYQELNSLKLGFGQKVLGIDGADLDGNGQPELYLTAADQGELRSLVVAFENGKTKVVKTGLPWYLRAIELPGEGRVLLAQRMGRLDEDFAGPIFRVVWRDGAPAEGAPIDVPAGSKLFGFAPIAAADGNKLFADLNRFDELRVIDTAGQVLWKGEERVGGSEAFIERPDPSKNPAEGPATRNVFMSARIAQGPDGTLLLPANEGSRAFSRVRSFDKSRLLALRWNGFALQEVWHTRPQPGYLADFRLADVDNDGQMEVVQALVFSRDGLMSKARSAIAVFELQP